MTFRAEVNRAESVATETETPKVNPDDLFYVGANDSLEIPSAQPTVATPGGNRAAPDDMTAPPPSPPQHDPSAVRFAKQFGLSQSQIDGATPAELSDWVFSVNQRMLAEQAAADRAAKAKPVAPVVEPAEDDIGISAEEEQLYDPKLLKILKETTKLTRQQNKVIKQLETKLQTAETREQNRVVEHQRDRVDATIAKLGKQFEPILGAKGWRELGENDAEMIRRQSVLSMAAKLAGPNATTEQQLAKIAPAAKALFGFALGEAPDETPETPATPPTQQRYTPEQQRWMNGNVATPTQRKTKAEQNGTAKAERSVADLLKNRGVTGADTETSLDDFPE